MQIKLRGRLYDATTEPIMILLTPQDKENIARMPDECDRYAQFPDDKPFNEILAWMDEPLAKARKQRTQKKVRKEETDV